AGTALGGIVGVTRDPDDGDRSEQRYAAHEIRIMQRSLAQGYSAQRSANCSTFSVVPRRIVRLVSPRARAIRSASIARDVTSRPATASTTSTALSPIWATAASSRSSVHSPLLNIGLVRHAR